MNTPATWSALVNANPSLRHWEGSAHNAALANWHWWPGWAARQGILSRDINDALPSGIDGDAFHEARRVALDHIIQVFRAARQRRHTNRG